MLRWEVEMNEIFREIKKHLLIYLLFVKNSMMAQMEYRFNFIGNMAMESGYLLVKLSYVVVVYRSGVKVNGLSPDEILLFIGTFVTLTGVYAGMFMINNFGLRSKIKDGDLDLLLTKPVSVQFMATLRQADVTIFSVDFIAGGIMVAIAWGRLGIPVTFFTVGGYIAFFVIS
jgi:ABC-2 type transport system permease protein